MFYEFHFNKKWSRKLKKLIEQKGKVQKLMNGFPVLIIKIKKINVNSQNSLEQNKSRQMRNRRLISWLLFFNIGYQIDLLGNAAITTKLFPWKKSGLLTHADRRTGPTTPPESSFASLASL